MRKRLLTTTLLATLAICISLCTTVLGEPRDPYQHFFNDTWGDLKEELNNAKMKGKKGILIFFELDECPYCHYMRTHVLNQPEVQKYFREHFLNFPIDIEGAIEITDFAGNPTTQKEFATKAHRVRATPVFAIFNLKGEKIVRYTGKTSGIDEFLLLGKYAAEGHYEKMPFSVYKRKQNK
ncbi:MAG: thioredoxin family protein [Gammaproteobacteria bacterium]|nr:thioredoxin family protein [Gammaproteobacteria bacterium]MDH5694402.1 thioredoxin family protein [Gammaproteobacteria bacterium]